MPVVPETLEDALLSSCTVDEVEALGGMFVLSRLGFFSLSSSLRRQWSICGDGSMQVVLALEQDYEAKRLADRDVVDC